MTIANREDAVGDEVPMIDIGPWLAGGEADRARVAAAFGDACLTWGFAQIAGHGVNPALIERIRSITLDFFDLPVEAKCALAASSRGDGSGYYPYRSKSHARTQGQAAALADLRETFMAKAGAIGSGADIGQAWPAELPEMESVWNSYRVACARLADELMRIAARALDLDEEWFEDKINRPISNLAAQHYPALDAPPAPGELRSGAHTDFGTLTLLLASETSGGLQLQALDGTWRDITPLPGTFIINIGDLMARWTNDRWRSTLHRVVTPADDRGSTARRLSIVYFHTPNADAVIECIPSCTDTMRPPLYAPILTGDHVREKLRLTDSVAQEKPGVSA